MNARTPHPEKHGAADRYVLAAIVLTILVHLAVVVLVPRQRIHEAMDALSAGGMQFNHWTRMERFAEPVADLALPNPDVMSAACVFDVSPGPVLINLAPWDAYWSLVFYDERGQVFETITDREAQGRMRFVLMRQGQREPRGQAHIVQVPSARGMAIVRRLAPSVSRHAEATRAAQADVCGNLQALGS